MATTIILTPKNKYYMTVTFHEGDKVYSPVYGYGFVRNVKAIIPSYADINILTVTQIRKFITITVDFNGVVKDISYPLVMDRGDKILKLIAVAPGTHTSPTTKTKVAPKPIVIPVQVPASTTILSTSSLKQNTIPQIIIAAVAKPTNCLFNRRHRLVQARYKARHKRLGSK